MISYKFFFFYEVSVQSCTRIATIRVCKLHFQTNLKQVNAQNLRHANLASGNETKSPFEIRKIN